jgi:hypothetical protein
MTYTARSFIRRRGESAIWRIKQYGARNAVTGFPAVSWLAGVFFDPACFCCDCFVCDGEIEIVKREIATREVEVAGTRETRKQIKFFTWPKLHVGDEVDVYGETYEVESSKSVYHKNNLYAYSDCVMIQVS